MKPQRVSAHETVVDAGHRDDLKRAASHDVGGRPTRFSGGDGAEILRRQPPRQAEAVFG
jgi:hypothetical protein